MARELSSVYRALPSVFPPYSEQDIRLYSRTGAMTVIEAGKFLKLRALKQCSHRKIRGLVSG
jgi:hypothetical protein